MLERRKLSRYKPPNDDLLLLCNENSAFCWIMDISTEGLSFEYIPDNTSLVAEKITVLSEENSPFFLPQIPCKTVYDIRVKDSSDSFSLVFFRRRGVKFVSPTEAQMKRVEQLLNNKVRIPSTNLSTIRDRY